MVSLAHNELNHSRIVKIRWILVNFVVKVAENNLTKIIPHHHSLTGIKMSISFLNNYSPFAFILAIAIGYQEASNVAIRPRKVS